MRLFTLGAGVAIGYIIGSKRGKAELERSLNTVKKNAAETWKDPKVQETVSKAGDTAKQYVSTVADSVKKRADEASAPLTDKAVDVAARVEDTVKKAGSNADKLVDQAADKVEKQADAAGENTSQSSRDNKSSDSSSSGNSSNDSSPGSASDKPSGTDGR